MPPAARRGDPTIGHGCFPPTVIDAGSSNVTINGVPAARETDRVVEHSCGDTTHQNIRVAHGSGTVLVNNLSLARISDPVTCGDVIGEGSGNVIVGK